MDISLTAIPGTAPKRERFLALKRPDHAAAPARRAGVSLTNARSGRTRVSSSGRVRTVCFVSGTRAEFGLMASTLNAIRQHPGLRLRIIATGMHLDPAHGLTLDALAAAGLPADAVVPWEPGDGPCHAAAQTGLTMAALPELYRQLDVDVVLVAGDRVEAFAAASAAHISGKIVAHVHGGDRALGQVDDALRHAISKLSHIHFPATPGSANRLMRMGEDAFRVRQVGSPGIDGIRSLAARRGDVMRAFPTLKPGRFALVVLHPTTPNEHAELRAAQMVLNAAQRAGFEQIVIVYPNNDPGSAGIKRCWDRQEASDRLILRRDIPRGLFLGLMRESAVLLGNSSSGMIEAASFGTPVVDVGRRQSGREHSDNVAHVAFSPTAIRNALSRVWRDGNPSHFSGRNVYDGRGTGRRIASILAKMPVNAAIRQKLVCY